MEQRIIETLVEISSLFISDGAIAGLSGSFLMLLSSYFIDIGLDLQNKTLKEKVLYVLSGSIIGGVLYNYGFTRSLLICGVIGAIWPVIVKIPRMMVKLRIKDFFNVDSGIIVRQQEKVLETKIQELEKRAEEKASIADFIQAELNVISERERLTMIKSQSRAGKLFIIGTILMIISVFMPIVSTIIYVNIDPISKETIKSLIIIKKEIGTTPLNKSISVQRDWRILVSGLSFGFLFLAAARGILRQEAQQRNTYFRFANRIAYYENIGGVLRINKILQENEIRDSINQETKTIIERIINLLMEKPSDEKMITYSERSDGIEEIPFVEKVEPIISAIKR